MSDQTVNRRGFLKWAVAAGVGAAAVAGGVGAFLSTKQSPAGPAPVAPEPSGPSGTGPSGTAAKPTPVRERPKKTGRWGAIGDPINLTVGYQPYCSCNWDCSSNRVAALWKKQLPSGSNVEWFEALSGPLLNNNLVAGKNAFIYACDTPASRTYETSASTNITLQCYEYCDEKYLSGILGRKAGMWLDKPRTTPTGEPVPKTTMSPLLVRSDLVKSGEVTRVEDFEGRKIGLPMGSYSHRQGEIIRGVYGVNPVYLDQSIELHVAQLRAKHIDGIATWGPYPTWIEMQGLAQIMLSGPEMPCSCKTGTHFHHSGHVVGLEEIVNERPDVVKGWIQGEEDARQMLAEDYKAGGDRVKKLVFEDTPEVPWKSIDLVVEEFGPDGYPFYPTYKEHYKTMSDHWRAVGVLKGKKSEDMQFYTDNYAFNDSVKQIFDEVIEEREAAGQHSSGDAEIVTNFW